MRVTPALMRNVLVLAVLFCIAALPYILHKTKPISQNQHASQAFHMRLDGTWEFAWGTFLSAQDALHAHTSGSLDKVDVPQDWTAHVPKDPQNPYLHGTATYVRKLVLPETHEGTLILHVERLPEAYQVLWVPIGAPDDTTIIASAGNLEGPAKPAYVDLSHPLTMHGEGLLVVHVRKSVLAWGGMFNPPHITTSEQDNLNRKLQRIYDGFWTGCLFFAVFQNLYLFYLRRSDWAPLMLGLASMIVMLHLAASSNTIEVLFGQGAHVLRTRIELLAVVSVGPILLLTVRYLMPPLVPIGVVAGLTAIGALTSGFVLVSPPDLMTYYLPAYEAFLVLVFLVVGYGLFRSFQAGKPGALTLLLSLTFIVTTAVHDIIASETGGTQFRMTAMASFLFIALCSLFVGRKVSDAVSRNQILEEEKLILQKLHSDAVDSARRDHLTGLLNRQAFDHEFTHAWRTANARVEPLSVVLFDIDHFKHVNDTYGHQVGDRVLRNLAERLNAFPLRRNDRLCRYGGEEFALILPSTPLDDAQGVAEKIREAIAASPLLTEDTLQLSITCSFGVACTLTASGCSAASLLEQADQALYDSKHGGRNRVNGVYSLQHARFPDLASA